MIIAINLSNFKAIGEVPARIELRPITLLFGPNSSGKSTILQALLYTYEILERGNLDADRTLFGGDIVDLGGFKTLLHQSAPGLCADHMRLGFELDLENHAIPEYMRDEEVLGLAGAHSSAEELEQLRQELVDDSLVGRLKRVRVELQIEWSVQLRHPVITELSLDYNDESFIKVTASLDAKHVAITWFNFRHPLMVIPARVDNKEEEPADHILKEFFSRYNVPATPDGEIPPREAVQCNLADCHNALPPLELLLIPELRSGADASTVDQLSRQLESATSTEIKDFLATAKSEYRFRLRSHRILTQLIVGPARMVRDELSTMLYVGPMRVIPPRNFQPPRYAGELGRWANGLGAWDALYRDEGDLLEIVSAWLSNGTDDAEPNKLNSGYTLRARQWYELDSRYRNPAVAHELFEVEDQLAIELTSAHAHKTIAFVEERTQLERQAYDIGIGLSQVLPVAVAALLPENGIVAIEQPELHIHPKVQVGLGDLFLHAASNGKTCLIETHSEYMILRLLKRIEQTTDNELPPGALPCTPKQVAVYIFQQTDEGVEPNLQEIDSTGEFVKEWPGGFFRERSKELF